MLQASILDCLFLDLFPFFENVFATSEVDLCRINLVQALVIAMIVVVIDKDTDLLLRIAWHVIVFHKNAFLHGLVPAFDFALSLRMEWSAASVFHFMFSQPFTQFSGDVPRKA